MLDDCLYLILLLKLLQFMSTEFVQYRFSKRLLWTGKRNFQVHTWNKTCYATGKFSASMIWGTKVFVYFIQCGNSCVIVELGTVKTYLLTTIKNPLLYNIKSCRPSVWCQLHKIEKDLEVFWNISRLLGRYRSYRVRVKWIEVQPLKICVTFTLLW